MGTDAWRNWNAFLNGEPEVEDADDDFYSDRHFVGGSTVHGPYTIDPIIGSIGRQQLVTVRPALRLTLGVHTNLIPDLVVDNSLVPPYSEAYHGGTVGDEIAALVSLSLGVRLRVAGTSRISGIHDPGDKQRSIYLEVPPLAHPGRPGREHIPAALTRPAQLDQLERLDSFPSIPEKPQMELVRAARAYATGLWWSNEDGNLAWLQLVSAIEVAANYRQQVRATAEELIADLWPELWAVLEALDPEVRAEISKLLAPQVRATRKFVSFLAECAPEPPEQRPSFDVLDWTRMADHAKLIYRLRSDALHNGKPFPQPMLEIPRREENGSIQEVPGGLTTGGYGAIWAAEETPMLLATFEHIARGALLKWWDELANG